MLKKVVVITLASLLVSGMVVAGCSSNPAPIPEEELTTYQLEINLLGEKNEFFIDSQGMLKSKVEVSSTDSSISLSLGKGTTVLDKDEKPLQIIHVVIDRSPPLPPENAYIISPVYKLEPQGAIFDAWLSLTLSYDPKKLPEGLRQDELYVAYHNGTKWCELRYKRVDTEFHSVTTHLSDFNFTSFAILGPKELTPPTPPIPTQGTQVGNLALNFQLSNLEGKTVSLSDLRGKPVLLNFWATWCNPCRVEMPYIQQVYEEWSGRGLVVLAINLGESPAKVKEFVQGYGLSFPVLLDTKGDVAEKYNIRYIPTTLFIDKNGIIQVKITGAFPNKAAIENKLGKIIP